MELIKVRTHTGIWGNKKADKLAKKAAGMNVDTLDRTLDNNNIISITPM
jgi:ribonuclease HI